MISIPLIHPKAKKGLRIIAAIFLLGLLSPLISNDNPLYVRYHNENLFPAFHWRVLQNKADDIYSRLNLYKADWKILKTGRKIFPLFTYNENDFDFLNADYVSPFEKQKWKDAAGQVVEMPLRYRHWLGTGKKGEDVLAILFYGARYTFTIAFTSVAIATIIGLFAGIVSGYFGNYYFRSTYLGIAAFLFGCLPGYFYGFHLRSFVISEAFAISQFAGLFQLIISLLIVFSISGICYFFGYLISRLLKLRANIFIPLDTIISKLIELLVSIPALIIIISLTALMKPSLLTIIVVIAITGWTVIARLVRAEFLKIKNLEYIESARALGYGNARIILKHILPNISSALFITVAFTIAAAIILESSLTFLGIGVPHDVVTWGGLLSQSKENFSAWWISLFPGGMIFLTLYCLNMIAENLRR